MAKMSYSEWLHQKKEGASAHSKSDAPANKPATNSPNTGSNGSSGEKPSYSEWLSSRKESYETESVNEWINQSINTLKSINDYYRSWKGGDDPQYEAYQQRLSMYLSMADNWRKMYSGNEDAIATINEVVSSLSDAKYNTMAIKDYYGQWGSKGDYLKWDAYRTPESRQARYEENKRRLEELREERKEAAGSTSIWSVMGFSDSSLPITAQTGTNSRLQEIDDEIAAIETEMRMYEHGNTGADGFYYGSKTVDDYYHILDSDEYSVYSGQRGYRNPARSDLQQYDLMADSTQWYTDASGNYYDVFGNYIDPSNTDEEGNIIHPFLADGRYAINDRLGLFLSASDEDKEEAAGTSSDMEGSWATVIKDGIDGSWSELTEDEIGIYYTILGSQGQAAAEKYLDDMTIELNRRQAYKEAANLRTAFDESSFLEKMALSLATVPTQLVGGAAAFVENTAYQLQGKDINPYSAAHSGMAFSQNVRGLQAKELEEMTGGIAIPFVNFTVGDLYQSGMSILDMWAGGSLGAGTYTALMGMSSAAAEATRLYEQGASQEQIFWGGALAGAAEMVFEKFSIESLIHMKDAKTVGQLVRNALIQGGVEASEEAFTEIANTITNAIVMGDQSDWAKLLEENNGDYSKALLSKLSDVVSAGLGGFFSGGIGGGAVSAVNYAGQSAETRRSGKAIQGAEGGVDALRQLANDVAGVTTEDGKKDLARYQKRLNKRQSNKNVGLLYEAVKNANNLANASANQADIAKSLQRKGFNAETAGDLAAAIVAQYNGQELTREQEKLLESAKDSTLVKEAIDNIVANTKSTMGQRSQNIRDFQNDVAIGNISRMYGAIAETVKTMAEGNLSGKNSAAQTASYEVSDDGQTRLVSDPEKVVSVDGIASMENGKVMLKLKDGSTVDAEDVSFGDSGDALVYATVAGLGLSVDTANTIIGAFDSGKGVSAQMYSLGLQEAYRNGKYNYAFQRAENDPYSDAMKLAWNEGRKAAIMDSQTAQAKVDENYRNAKNSLEQDGKKKSGEYHAVLEDGITEDSLNESQKASYRLADSIAQAAKVDILVYAGKTGELGFYDPNTDTIHLNVNGMNKSGKSMMAFTLGHELVHRAKKGSPAKYQAFADFLVENYGKRGADLEAMISEQLDAAKKYGIKMSRDQAFEEVVCDACQRMLLDTDAGKRLAQFGEESRQNKGILEDIKRWIEEFMQKLREIFKGVEPDSLAAKEFAKFDDGVKRILADMYVDMTVDAGEHLSAIRDAFGKDTIVLTNEQGEFTVAESRDGSGKVFNLTTWENGGRETLEAALLREGYTREEVDAALTIMDEKQKLVEAIANEVDGNGKPAFPEQGRINEATLTTDIKDGHAVLSALVSNGDYPVNIDLLMVCKKRKAYQRVINRLCETGMIKQATVDALAIAQINKILGKYGFETACLGCFVESRRLRIQEWAQTIVREWNGEVKKRNPNAKAFGFGKGEATLTSEEVMQLIGELESGGKKNEQGNLNLGQGSAVKRMGVLLDKVPSLRRTLSVEDLITPDGLSALRRFDGNLFSIVKSRYGSNSPKFVQEFNPYNHELAKYGTVPTEYKSLRDYLYAIGGARMQSFSDFIVENWFDYCQIVADLAARKLPMHTYTKEIALAKLFGMTGIKINMSLIPDVDRSLGKEYAGLTRNSNGELDLIWADKDRFKATGGKSYMQSINFADAVALQNDPRYSANVGTIAIGISDMQIRMMLADPRIRMVIPYHSSGMNPIYADLMGTSFYKDYTNFQNTTVKQLYNSKGKPVSLKLDKTQTGKLTGGFLFNKTLQELGDARAAADAYKEWCADSSLHTITINGETYTAELTPKFADFASEENYYKLLEDFNTYDCITEEAAPQVDVKQVYPDGFEDILRGELSGQERYRQKQEKNQAFDKAMGEIEGYLNSHTKADTVYYAEQHGVKLGAKDKKLDAAGKERLKQLQKEGASFSLPKSDQEYMDAVERGDMETAQRMVNERAEALRAEVFAQTDVPTYRIRRGSTPKNTIKVYKVFTMSSAGKPSALFVSSQYDLPIGVWLDAQDTYHFTDQRNGHMYVPSTKNPNTKGGATGRSTNVSDISAEDIAELEKRGYLKRDKNGKLPKSITSLAYRPGWHAGDLPFFPQGGMQIEGSNYPNVHRYNQVVFECEMIADHDYTDYHVTDDGKVQLHDMQQMPDNGSYKYSTNPMAQSSDIGAWYIGSSIKIVRALTQAECDRILQEKGRPVQEWQAYQDADELKRVKNDARSRYTDKKTRDEAAKAAEYAYEHRYGALDLDALGYDPTQTDGGKKLLDAVTYDDDGNVIPLSQRFNPKVEDVRYSLPKTNSPYSYESLISKPDMVVTTVGGNVPNNRADVAYIAKQNAAKVGRFDPKTGSVSVYVSDIDTDVILSTKGLRHGLRRTNDPLNVPNYIVTVKAGEILKNSIRINEITPSDENARSSYVLFGAARDANGTYVVRFVVNHFDNSVSSMDVLYAVNAKKEPAATKSPRLAANPLSVTGSTISISELLDIVNQYFPDILPEEALKHYGYDARPEGDLGADALYKLPVGEDTSPRALLANAFEELAKTDAEKESIRKYQERVTQFQELEAKQKDIRAQIRELYTADGKLDTKKIRELQFEANATANRIETLDRMLLRTESTQQFQNVLKREQDQARAREIKKAKDAVIAFRHDASAEIRETMRDYEAARSALVGRDTDMDIIEREFLRVVKEYEKEKQSGEKTAESLRRSLDKEAKKHQKDNDLWEREFNRMLRQYEKSTDYIGVLERRVDKAKQVRDNAAKRDAVGKLQKLVLDTTNWIAYPGKKDVKCPDLLKKPYADFLNSIDLSSKRLASGGDPTKNDLKLANAMGSLATALESITMAQDPNKDAGTPLDSGYLDLPAGFVQTLREMTEKIKDMIPEGEFVVSTMTADDVKQLSKMIRTLNHAIREMSTLYANSRFANVAELSGESMGFMDSLGEMENTSGPADFVKWDNVLPYYAFKRFGTGGESIFEGLMDAQDKLAFLAQEIFNFRDKTWTDKEAKAWGEDSHTIDLPSGGKLTLTTSDAMSIYCLSRRQQGLKHLLGGGVRVVGLQKGSRKSKDSRSILSIQDVDAINSSLTDRQRKVAEAIQEFMSTVCSEWGNEISMKRFLTREFTEKNYFPIESNDENLSTKDPAAQQSDLFRLLNIAATKPIDPRANNEVIVRNIFDVFTGHASDMARLNAFGMPLLDYMKWLNYREKTTNEDGQVKVRGVRKSMETAFGSAAKSYVLNLIKDVNGRASDGGDPSFLMKMMRNAKTAAVGNSLRVATLQMTSYPRAALVLSPKSLALGLTKKPNIGRAMKYCGIALWKSFGFYDTNISRSIEDQMKGVVSVKQKMIELSLKGAELGDALTWGILWNACEYEVAKSTRNKVGSEGFYQEVGKKLREVVYATQVVDSTLTRSQIMRSKYGKAQEASAFMSEPTLSANILMDAGFQFSMEKRRTGSAKKAWKTTGKYIGRAIAVYSFGQITAALMEAIWDAWRDDDDDEYIEKYWKALKQNLVLDILPFNKVPIVSDLVKMALATAGVGFFSSGNMSTEWLSHAKSAADSWSDVLNSEGSVTVYGALYKTMRAVSSACGVSFSGVMREGVALWNNTAGAYDSTLKIRTYSLPKSKLADELLGYLIEGDDRRAESLREEFDDADDAKSNLRTAIKNRFSSGEIDKSTAMKYLVLYAEMDAGDAYWKVDEWSFDNMSSDSEEYSKYGGFYDAVETGKSLSEVIRSYTDNGVSMETLRSEITEHFQPVYSEMTEAERAGIRAYLINAYEQCGSSREEAEWKLQYWDFLAENPGSNLSIYQVTDYYEYAKPAGISAKVYSDYCERVKGITGDGKKARRMDVIDSLPITDAQKDALYFSEGWAESTLREAPWH